MILGVVGSRGFSDYPRMKRVLSEYAIKKIVSGGAKGADSLAERYAKENSIPVLKHIPDWSQGKSAGIKRNVKIVDDAEGVVAFWDGNSPGTKHSIDLARKNNKLFRVEYFGSASPIEYSFSGFRLTSSVGSTEYVLPRVETYTDGSCAKASKNKPARSGWGYCLFNSNITEVDSGEKPGATNNEMELRAFYEGLKRGLELGLPFDIYSDSQYTIKSFYDESKVIDKNTIEFSCELAGWSKNWTSNGTNPDALVSRKNGPLLFDIYTLLRKNNRRYRVFWVRGHSNLAGNEIADRLASGGYKEIHRYLY